MSYGLAQYQNQSGSHLSPREIETLAFRHVNGLLSTASNRPDRQNALTTTLKLWGMLLQSIDRADCPLDHILRKDILSIGTWALRYANAALNTNSSLQPLIDINTDMIEGLTATPPPHPCPVQHNSLSTFKLVG